MSHGRFHPTRRLLPPLVLLLLWTAGQGAESLAVRVNSVATDVVYLAAGSANGLVAGMRGTLCRPDGRQVEVEVLFVSSGRASGRVHPAGVELRVGDEICFEPVGTAPAPAAAKPLPPAGVAALERRAAATGIRAQGWWRAEASRWSGGDQDRSMGRGALGLRAGPAPGQGWGLSLQMRHQAGWGGTGRQDGRLDELALSGPALAKRLTWQVGRLADGRGALGGPLDGLSVERAGSAPLLWGISTGSRPTAGERSMGAGLRLRWRDRTSPWDSDLKLRLERTGEEDRRGLSWNNQWRFLSRGRFEHWLRAEDRGADTGTGLLRISSTRLRWLGGEWQAEAGHQLTEWPRPETGLPAVVTPLVEPRRQQLTLALGHRVGGLQARLQGRARGVRLDSGMERLVGLGLSHHRTQGLLNRADLDVQLLLGPRDRGGEAGLNLGLAPPRLPGIELGLRGWRVVRQLDREAGAAARLFLHGRLPASLRWEAGTQWHRLEQDWQREWRLGLRGDLRLRPGRERAG